MNKSTPLLQVKNLFKNFPGVKALSSVNFSLNKGEIHGLMGENGAGKSTLIKVITGVYQKEKGEILLNDRNFRPHSPMEAAACGISTVYQEINLIPFLSVAENIFLGRQPVRSGRIDWNSINSRASKVLERLNINIDVTRPLASYSIAIQQMTAIARALDISAKILILDEPTSSLDEQETRQLFSVMKKLKKEGLGIIFITHFIDQVFAIADRITVLRNGELVGEYRTKSISRLELISRMLGKKLTEFSREEHIKKEKRKKHADKKVFFRVRGMERKGTISAFDLDIHSGEVLGLAGLLGSGRTEIARLLFGIDKAHKGETILNGKKISISSPVKAIENYFGFCPEDRKAEGIIPDLTVRENIILAIQARKGIFKTLPVKKQKEIADRYIKTLNIVTPTDQQTAGNLSGGNQQKVIVARWLASNPEFLILDEPTRGIDVGAKAEIQKLVLSLARDGMAILFISSELEEVVRCSDRIIVLRDRKKLGELTNKHIEEKAIMHFIAHGREDE